MGQRVRVGAWKNGNSEAEFRVWAPQARSVEVIFEEGPIFSLESEGRGYFHGAFTVSSSLYRYRLDGEKVLPDPASRFQPAGVQGPSQILPEDFSWSDHSFCPPPFSQWVIYELHVGTFSSEGTFAGVVSRLDYLQDLGVNAIEIMPVAQFSGRRNWGYDGVMPFAVQNSYGGSRPAPEEFKTLIDECHRRGMAVILDVVYNHFGPEGNYFSQWGSYFQEKYKTPWGNALNFDGPGSDEVRNFFLQNVEQWYREYHVDALRLDAVHGIFDTSAKTFLEEVAEVKERLQSQLGKDLILIAESDANNPDILESSEKIGMTAQWADDMHHVLHTLLTGEDRGYYADFGAKEQLGTVLEQGVFFQGQYSCARQRSHGRSYEGVSRQRLVVCSQNHDQVGNRGRGERLLSLVGERPALFAAACVFLSGATPLIFMGEEYGEERPFLYFVDHQDPALKESVRRGRQKEFSEFSWGANIPDPCDLKTFEKSKLNWKAVESPQGQRFLLFYKELISLSKEIRREGYYENHNVQGSWTEEGDFILKAQNRRQEYLWVKINFAPSKQKVPSRNGRLIFDYGGIQAFKKNQRDDYEKELGHG